MERRRQSANEKLRSARRARLSPSGSGHPLSRQEVADACNTIIDGLCRQRGRRRRWSGLTASFIGSLERGEVRWPNEEYRQALTVFFGTSDADLGLYIDRPDRPPTTAGASQVLRKVVGQDLDVDGVVDTGRWSDAFARSWTDLWELHEALRGRGVGRRGVELIESHCAQLDESYVEVSADELLPEVRTQLRRVVECLGWPQPAEHRRRLCASAGRLAGLRAWLLFDLADYRAADSWYDIAIDAAQEADDPSLCGWLIGARSLIPTYRGDHRHALALAEHGQAICSASADASVHAWLAAIQARAHAGLGDAAGLRRSINHAAVAAGSSDLAQRRHGMDFHHGSLDLTYYEGTSLLLVDEPAAATASLITALDGLPATRPKARAVLTLCLADAATQQHHLDQARDLICRALSTARDQPIQPILQRATQIRDRLRADGLGDTTSVDERLAAFATGFGRLAAGVR